MSKWSVEFTREAEKDLAFMDGQIRKRVIEKIDWLGQNFSDILPTILTADFRDYFKLRVGDWRVFYQVDWRRDRITIRYIDHRSKAYRKGK